MPPSNEQSLLNPDLRRNVVENVMALDPAAQSYEALIIGSICAVMDRRFTDAETFVDRIAALAHTTARPNIEHLQMLLHNVNAIKATLYGDDAITVRQCGKLLKLMELLDPELVNAPPGRRPAIGRPRRFEYADQPLPDVDADVIARRHFFGPGSRLHDIGWRTATGLGRGGWRTREADLRLDLGSPDALAAFVARPSGSRRRFAFVDLMGFYGLNDIPEAVAFLERLRPHYDAVVCMLFDAWTSGLDVQFRAYLPLLDLIWSVHPFAETFRDPAITAKTTFIPVMTGIDPDVPAPPPAEGDDARLSFTGAIGASNIHRLYWYLLSRGYPEHLHFSLSTLHDDGLSVGESQARYLDRLRRTKHCLNLCRRSNGERILTGRAFEVSAVNRLLIQEYSEDVRFYFTPGEHFVEFETADELLAAADDVRSRPEHFRRVAGNAHRLFLQHYADPAIVRHLSHRLG